MTVPQPAPRPPIATFGPDAIPAALAGGVVAIGNFDGIHRGHAALIGEAVRQARALGVPAVVLTFEPHPRTLFRPDTPVFRLTPLPAKVRLLAALGVDGVVVMTFDRALAGMTAEDFVATIIAGRLKARTVVVGANFRFGKGRAGTVASLSEAGARLGFTVSVFGEVAFDGTPVSSSAIRAALGRGDIAVANRLLGYHWFVTGEVVPGDRRGRELGFPTANIRLAADCGLMHGIYAVTLAAGGVTRDGAASYGRRPTFDNGPPLLEVHVLDFTGDLYGQEVVVTFYGFVRPEERFDSVPALVAAMERDVATARAILAAPRSDSPVDAALPAP